MREDLKFISETLAEAVERRRVRTKLQYGLSLRRQVLADLKTNPSRATSHYRYQWVVQCSTDLFNMALDMCRKFDVEHPEDQASTFDLVDILKYALATAEAKQADMLGGQGG